MTFTRSVKLVEFPGVSGHGRDTIIRAKYGWQHATGDLLGLSGVSLIWSPNVISTALKLILSHDIQAVDGITRHLPGDNHFLAVFQDKALVTEFPVYKSDIILDLDSFATTNRLPTLTSFFMTAHFFARYSSSFPDQPQDGWEDFDAVRRLVESGGKILLSNQLVAYRNHRLTLRLGKQFSSGCSAANYLFDHPQDPYAQSRLSKTVLIGLFALGTFLLWMIFAALYGLIYGLMATVTLVILVCLPLGLLNAITARDIRGLLFPPLMIFQIVVWVLGFFYEIFDRKDTNFLAWIHAIR